MCFVSFQLFTCFRRYIQIARKNSITFCFSFGTLETMNGVIAILFLYKWHLLYELVKGYSHQTFASMH